MIIKYEISGLVIFLICTSFIIWLSQDTPLFANLILPVYFLLGITFYSIGKLVGELETRRRLE